MIDQLRQKISRGQMEYSLHAVRQMVERGITPEEAAQTVLAGEVIEDYLMSNTGRVAWFVERRRVVACCTFNARIRAVRS